MFARSGALMARSKQKNKYGAKKTTCLQGHAHPSKKEAGYCNAYHIDQSRGKISNLKCSPFFPFVINGINPKMGNGHRCGYTADFQFDENDKQIVIEVKGMVVRDWPLRKAVFEACYPDLELRVV